MAKGNKVVSQGVVDEVESELVPPKRMASVETRAGAVVKKEKPSVHELVGLYGELTSELIAIDEQSNRTDAIRSEVCKKLREVIQEGDHNKPATFEHGGQPFIVTGRRRKDGTDIYYIRTFTAPAKKVTK